MSLPRGTIEGRPTLTIIDLLEKHKGTGAFRFKSLSDAIAYISRTLGDVDLSASDLQALTDYMARDGAAWVKGINFHSKKLPAMIKEMELTARPPPGRRGVPFGVLVISISKNDLPRTKQMRHLKVAALKALKYLSVRKNRAFLAIHDDTDHLHVHIVYNRYDSKGQLTEREPGKFRRYLMEDVCARVAFDIGYNLESGAQTVPTKTGELMDLASRRIIRTADFAPVIEGCKTRNHERQRARTGHELEELALEAYHSSDSLRAFRARLALDGIRYVNKGSGAVFIDPDGKSHKASKVNYRLSRGRVFDSAYNDGLPDETNEVLRMVATVRGQDSVVQPASGNDAPRYDTESGLSGEQADEANRRLVLGYSDAGCGRPRKVDMGEAWPKGFPWGGVRFPERYLDQLRSSGVDIKQRRYHAELWREQRLIAVHRQDQIVVYTRDKDDLRILLLAAHQKWGSVALTGSKAFRRRVVDLAAELNVPITNPDLQRRMKAQQRKLAARRVAEERTAIARELSRSTASDPVPSQSNLDDARSGAVPSSGTRTAADKASRRGNMSDDVARPSKLDAERPSGLMLETAGAAHIGIKPSQQPSGEATADPTLSSPPAADSPINVRPSRVEPASAKPQPMASGSDKIELLLRELRATDQFVEQAPEGYRLAQNANHRRALEPLLGNAQLQIGLADLFKDQQDDLDRFQLAIRQEGVSICLRRDVTVHREHTLQPAGLQGEAAELYRRYQYHPRCKVILRMEHERREATRQAEEDRRGPAVTPPKVMPPSRGTSSADAPERSIREFSEALGIRPPPVTEPDKPHQVEAIDPRVEAHAGKLEQQSRTGSVKNSASDNRLERAQRNAERRPAVVRSGQPVAPPVPPTGEGGGVADLHDPSSADRNPGRPAPPRPQEKRGISASAAVSQMGSIAGGPAIDKEPPPKPSSEAVADMLGRQLHSGWKSRANPQCAELLNGLPAKLGGDWALFQENWKRYAGAPDGKEKDCLAFVINTQLQIAVSDRGRYPPLRAIFQASDRNLSLLQREQQAELRRRQGGW